MEHIAAEQQWECQCSGLLFLGLQTATTGSVTEDRVLLSQKLFHKHDSKTLSMLRNSVDTGRMKMPRFLKSRRTPLMLRIATCLSCAAFAHGVAER